MCDVCLFWSAATLAQIAVHISEESFQFLCRFLLISVPKSYGFDILKRCGEELKIPVSYIDGDDVNVEEGF